MCCFPGELNRATVRQPIAAMMDQAGLQPTTTIAKG